MANDKAAKAKPGAARRSGFGVEVTEAASAKGAGPYWVCVQGKEVRVEGGEQPEQGELENGQALLKVLAKFESKEKALAYAERKAAKVLR